MELKDRLRIALDLRGMGAQTVERAAGLSNSVVGNIALGKRKFPRPETLDKIAKVLQVSHQWLATGEGSMEPGEELVLDEYPGRADLRRTDWWRSLPEDLQASVMRAVPSDPEMPLDGWIDLVRYLKTFGAAPETAAAPFTRSSDPPPMTPPPLRARR